MFRYRVPIVRRGQDGQVADPALREHIYLHARNAIHAALAARAVTGAAIALEPERLGEVQAPTADPHLAAWAGRVRRVRGVRMTTSSTLDRIERLAYDRQRLAELLQESLVVIKRVPGGYDLSTRIANELARQLAGGA